MRKPVIVSVSLVPNLLQHTLVGVGVGRFQDMVNPVYKDEMSSWIQCDVQSRFSGKFQKIEGISSSTWFALLYQIPSYLAEDNLASVLSVLDMLSTDEPLEVISKFPEKAKLIHEYIPQQAFSQYVGFEGVPSSFWSDVIADFIDAVESGYERTYEDRWKVIEQNLQRIRENLMARFFEGFDWVSWWEKRTGIDFPYPCFNAELIDTTITQGTSLLAERDGFYAHTDLHKIVNVVSHEISTHLLYNRQAIEHPITRRIIEEDLERYLRTVEIVSWAMNKEVIQERGFEWTMEHSFDWIGPAKDDVVCVLDDKSPFWELMARGYHRMKT